MATQPTAQDQYMLELLNRARLDPQAEANRLLNGNLNEGLTAGTITVTAKQALAFNLNLFNAAQAHSQWMLANNTFSHTGANGTSSSTRVTNAGYSWSTTGENLAWQGTTGTADLTTFVGQEQDSLFTDLTVAGRGHRTNMLNANYREIGISAVAGPFTTGGTTYSSVMTTQDFGTDATNSNAFLTGVVYTDAVTNDDFYTVGEGLGNITITAVGNGQTFTGNSMTAGGYSLRLAAGTYSVTFSGDFNNDGVVDTSTARSVTIGSQNVKVDFASDTYVPLVTTPTEGNDVLTGTASADNINALGGNDRVSGLAGNDTLYGGIGNDYLDGGAGNDILDGGTGADTLVGGTGDDTYGIDNVGDVVIENASEGTDTVWTSVSYSLTANVENLYLVGSINGYGNSGNNTIGGYGVGDNVIDGGAGADTMSGGAGNDTYGVDNTGDTIVENANEGIDTVWTSVNYSLSANVENLYLVGSINGYGNSGNNTIGGYGVGDNVIDGGAGADTMGGGAGNDTYGVDNIGDTIVENDNEGIDTIWTSVNYSLSANVENLYLVGSINGNGNSGNNTIVGYGAGDNVIAGGAGNDTLYGGAGNDTFVFDSSSFLANVISGLDTIGDFTATQDKIQLSKAAFAALSSSAGTLSAYNSTSLTGDFVKVTNATQAAFAASAATILYNSDTGALLYNADGNIAGFGNGGQFAGLTAGLNLTGNDFKAIA
jgi:Ca2+-binding RTX toxin-like protein